MTTGNAGNEALVREFCEAWSRGDVDEVLGYFADDAVYHNMPMAPAKGHTEIRTILEFILGPARDIEFEVLALASSGDLVFTERVDRFSIDRKPVALPVAGVFEVRDGKILAWRDYFDMQTWTNQTT